MKVGKTTTIGSRNHGKLLAILFICILVNGSPLYAATYHGDPGNYRELVGELQPGDRLELEAGFYRHGLPLHDIQGSPEEPIIIRGAERHRSVFLARPGANTVSFTDAAYIEVRDLVVDGRGLAVDAVKAEGHANWAHHITVEGLVIYGHGNHQQTVAISTKCPAWGWVIRNNTIIGAGTGMYFGDSDGSAPFFDSVIEHNVITGTLGYNLQIKHQMQRPDRLPAGGSAPGTTIIRHNVFSKGDNSATEIMARPNVLVGHWPLSGKGSDDLYQIYGNFFYENPTESLFQGEGNIALYDNIFVNSTGDAVAIQAHKDVPRRIHVFHNTVIAGAHGIAIRGADPQYPQRVFANAVFAAVPLLGGDQAANISDKHPLADKYLSNPFGTVINAVGRDVRLLRLRRQREYLIERLGEDHPEVVATAQAIRELTAADEALQEKDLIDLYPKPGRMTARPLSQELYKAFLDAGQDFNGQPRDGRFRGAYAGDGVNPGWQLQLDRKGLKE